MKPGAMSGEQLYKADEHAPGEARRHVRRRLGEWGLRQVIDAAELIVTELVTNAVKHGGGPEVGLFLSLRDQSLVVGVWDWSASLPEPPVLKPARVVPGLAESGRGLVIVDSLCVQRDVFFDASGRKCVCAEILIPGGQG